MRLLVIDDEKPLKRSLVRGLKDRGFAVDFANGGADGEMKAQETAYDVIVLNGISAHGDILARLSHWRRAGVNANVFVLAKTNRLRDELHCLDFGADAYLTTPFEPEELFARLRALIRRNHPQAQSVLRVHDLVIDPAARVVKRQGRTIHLTPREFALLEFLVRRRGQIVSRATIWASLYDYQEGSSSNVVDVYIRYLRSKIDKGFDLPLIHTRYGQGYLIRAD